MKELFTRRSVRKYLSTKVKDEDVQKLLKAAMYAPSAINEQPWEFIVIKDKNTLNKLSEKLSPLYAKSNVTIILCMRDYDLKSPTRTIQDMSACMQNMMLEATHLGIGSCWIGTYPDQERMTPLIEILNIPSNVIPFCGLTLGYPAKADSFKEVSRKAIVYKEKYGA